jgi:hypothetical protein
MEGGEELKITYKIFSLPVSREPRPQQSQRTGRKGGRQTLYVG